MEGIWQLGVRGLLAAGGSWGKGPGRRRKGLPAAGRPPRRAARLISMGEGRWRGGAAGRAGTSRAGPAGRAETQSASDDGHSRAGSAERGVPAAGAKKSAWARRGLAARRS